jgi:hemerythrin
VAWFGWLGELFHLHRRKTMSVIRPRNKPYSAAGRSRNLASPTIAYRIIHGAVSPTTFSQIFADESSSPDTDLPKEESPRFGARLGPLASTREPTASLGEYMHRFELTSASSTGNPDIDAQLKTLFGIANELLFETEPEQRPQDFRREVSFLLSYLEYHFASEELAMLECGFTSRRFHSAFHDHVRREIRSISARLDQRASIDEIRSAIFFVLEDWAVYHVADADRHLATYLGENAPTGTVPRMPGIQPLKANGSLRADFDERVVVGLS